MQRRVVLLRLPGLALRGVLIPVACVPRGCHSRARAAARLSLAGQPGWEQGCSGGRWRCWVPELS